MAKEVLDGLQVEYCTEEINDREDCVPLQDMFAKITGERTVNNRVCGSHIKALEAFAVDINRTFGCIQFFFLTTTSVS